MDSLEAQGASDGGGLSERAIQTLRASNKFCLKLYDLAVGDLHPLDVLLLLTIIQANAAPVANDPVLQERFAGVATPIAAELRRPISTSRLAASLRLPLETVRRRVRRLADKSLCEGAGTGWAATMSLLAPHRHGAMLADAEMLTRDFYFRCAENDLLELPEPGMAAPASADQGRLVARTVGEYLLRSSGLVTRFAGDAIDGMIFQVIADACTPTAGSDRPARILASSVGRRLGLSEETARRRLADLERRGLCRRGPTSRWVASLGLKAPELSRVAAENEANLRRMFALLARHGVLERWRSAEGRLPAGGQRSPLH